jgi:hypothetical protein
MMPSSAAGSSDKKSQLKLMGVVMTSGHTGIGGCFRAIANFLPIVTTISFLTPQR